MNYINPKKIVELIKAAKRLSGFGVLIFGISLFFYSFQTHSQATSPPDCASITGNAEPGVNCGFLGLPLCNAIPSASYAVATGYVLPSGTAKIHRQNCADLSDLTLCSDIDTSQYPNKNCVRECKDISDPNPNRIPANVKGIDYAVHNRDCVRFKDAPESGVTATDSNSIARRCHQMTSTSSTETPPSPGVNCELLSCKLLTTYELNKPKFRTESTSRKNYCDGDKDTDGSILKCYKFSREKLPYVILNTTCKIHSCPSPCGEADILAINAKGENYVTDYTRYVNATLPITSGLCSPVTCKPVVKRQYRCTSITNGTELTVRNPSCDESGTGATCTGGFCYLTIDCNLSSNNSKTECITPSEDGTFAPILDTMNSWFYRPMPMTKSTTSGGALRNMEAQLCYTKSQMESFGWGEHPTVDLSVFGLGRIDLGYYHSYLLPGRTRSPGLCNGIRDGSRGAGYIYLCGNSGNLYSNVEDYTAYHKGYVSTSFNKNSGTHKLVVCLRFKNAMRPDDVSSDSETCGSRECGISCAFGICLNQVCGYDVCRELTVSDDNAKQCMMDNDMFLHPNNDSRECAEVIDGYLRIRAVKYPGNRICTFLDVKGQLAYPDSNPLNFLNSSEKLSDKTCISGELQTDGSCKNGKSSFDDRSDADRWRAIKLGGFNHIPYIKNNRSGGLAPGYLDREGRLFPEQECIKTALRIDPPATFNLANIENSPKLFTPPLFIRNSSIIRGGSISESGKTDFHYPEIIMQFGNNTETISLGIGYTGYEETGGDSAGSKTIETTVNSIKYSLETFVRKEYDGNGSKPIFCLYRKVKDVNNGAYLNPIRIGCVDRILPEINNTATSKKILLSLDGASTYDNSLIKIRYLGGFGANGVNDNCGGDDKCTASKSLTNSDVNIPTCNAEIESHKICAQREECSQLNNECIVNEITMQNNKIAKQPIDRELGFRKNCNEILLPKCNKKKGITSDDSTYSSPAKDNYYGWFNEICITSGFETKLRKIVAYVMDDGTLGKCLINRPESCQQGSNAPGCCPEGGKAPDCECVAYANGTLPAGQIARLETPHEAGLCVDMPIPKSCSAIDYNTTGNLIDPTDTDFIKSSLGHSSYGSSTSNISNVVHISHKSRMEGNSDSIPADQRDTEGKRTSGANQAEFDRVNFGMDDVEGTCKGFWRAAKNNNGVVTPPKRSCSNVNGEAQWGPVTNSCIRYSCSEISTSATGPDSTGLYQGGYGALENGEQKGSGHGYATWYPYTKTNDFLETTNSFNFCITGFQPVSSSVSPTRKCNQLGEWQPVTNPCVRIICPAITPPTNPSTTAHWTEWRASGGATFPATNASRSSLRIQAESVATGTCNTALGFFKIGANSDGGGTNPTRECNDVGQWGPVINPCTTRCDATITPDSGSGFAYWRASEVSVGLEVDGVLATNPANSSFGSCATGYYPYPYPPLRDKSGNALTVPQDLENDTRAAETSPKRVCRSLTISGNPANVWTNTSSSCVNSCVSSVADPRIGAGKTKHTMKKTNGYEYEIVDWPEKEFGSYEYKYSPELTSQLASHYKKSRDSGATNHYALSRYCNNVTHKWDAPVPLCVANGGVIWDNTGEGGSSSFATYSILHIKASSSSDSNRESTSGTKACISEYAQTVTGASNTAKPIRDYVCSYKNANEAINEVYFDNKPIDQDTGDICRKSCRASSFDAAVSPKHSYSGGLDYFAPGTTIYLDCRSGYGKATDLNPTNWDNNCGREAADRTNLSPAVTCGENGSWGAVLNECTACRSCAAGGTASNPDFLSINYATRVSAFDKSRGLNVDFSPECVNRILNHNETELTSCQRIAHQELDNGVDGPARQERSWDMYGNFTVKCTDGALTLYSSTCSGTCP